MYFTNYCVRLAFISCTPQRRLGGIPKYFFLKINTPGGDPLSIWTEHAGCDKSTSSKLNDQWLAHETPLAETAARVIIINYRFSLLL